MRDRDHIIDVTPVAHSNTRIRAGRARVSGSPRSGGRQRQVPRAEARPVGSPLAGIAQMALGAGLVAVGIPMLVLPGPGLLSIGTGVALAARGLRKVGKGAGGFPA